MQQQLLNKQPLDLTWLRSILFIVSMLLIGIIIVDVYTMPQKNVPYYNTIRVLTQFLPILCAFIITFFKNFQKYYQNALLIFSLIFSFGTLYIIWAAWIYQQYAFAYEGLMINVYFFFFVTRISFRHAIIYTLIVNAVFLLLIFQFPIYQERTVFNAVMLISAHLMALVGVHRLMKIAYQNDEFNKKLFNYSITDELTQIHNRKGYLQFGSVLFEKALNNNLPFSFFMFDLDDFKLFNDQFGHTMGDELLQKQAQILKQVFDQNTDIICRFGGDEFIVISLLDKSSSIQKAQTVLNQWEKQNNLSSIVKTSVTCSIGIHSNAPVSNQSLNDYFQLADQALYKAKNKGKNNIVST